MRNIRTVLILSVGLSLIVTGCAASIPTGDSANFIDSKDAFAIPNPPENSDHGYLTADDRIPTIDSCDEWREFFVYPGPAVSFAVAELFPDERFEVATEIYLKNRDLDKNEDGVICHFEDAADDAEPVTKISPQTELASINKCKVPQGGSSIEFVTRSGFPQHPDYVIPTDRKIVIQLIYVDGQDLRGSEKPESDARFWIDGAGNFLKDVTDSRIDFDWRFANEYFGLPKELAAYNLTREKQGDAQAFVQDAITAADSKIDFSDVDIVVAVPPPSVSIEQIDYSPAVPLDASQPFRTNEGTVFRGTLAGADTRWDEGYLLIAHEIGHLLGLQDYYSYKFSPGDTYEEQFKFMGEFDNMNFAPGKAREWTAWSRWLLGSLSDNQVRCLVGASETTHKVTTISVESGESKAVVIPTGTYSAIVVESRKSLRNDRMLPESMQGLLVYRVNTTRDSGFGPLEIVKKEGIKDSFLLDAALALGESVMVEGFKIENVESGRFWDVAKITQAK